MSKKNRNDKAPTGFSRQTGEVLTEHDEKAERESPDRRLWERESDRPDGTSGNWT